MDTQFGLCSPAVYQFHRDLTNRGCGSVKSSTAKIYARAVAKYEIWLNWNGIELANATEKHMASYRQKRKLTPSAAQTLRIALYQFNVFVSKMSAVAT
jgi:hypothetical protein